MDRAGIAGADGPTHHGLLDLAYLRGYPNIVLMAPKDEAEMRDMLLTAIEYPGPAALRYPRGSGVGVDIGRPPEVLEIGRGEVLREGEDIAIIAYGSMVMPAVEAAGNLEKNGIDATVVNARFVKPMDEELIAGLAEKHRLIVTVEEAYLAGGFGSAVIEVLEQHGMQDKVKVIRMGVPDRIVTHGEAKPLLAQFGLDAEGISGRVASAMDELGQKSSAGKRLRAVK
jgi:1-deoxy-D-xylulose-5-phosphate synthase